MLKEYIFYDLYEPSALMFTIHILCTRDEIYIYYKVLLYTLFPPRKSTIDF